MSLFELTKGIPANVQAKTADSLMDLILNSQNAPKLSGALARSILLNWQKNQLATETGLTSLLEASLQLEPQKTCETFVALNLSRIADSLRTRVQSERP